VAAADVTNETHYFTYWFFFIYPSVILRSFGPDSIITHLHILIPFPCSFLLVVGWWMFPPRLG